MYVKNSSETSVPYYQTTCLTSHKRGRLLYAVLTSILHPEDGRSRFIRNVGAFYQTIQSHRRKVRTLHIHHRKISNLTRKPTLKLLYATSHTLLPWTRKSQFIAKTIWHHVPEDSNLHIQSHENLKSHTAILSPQANMCIYWNTFLRWRWRQYVPLKL
jgi:hypothetical protein